MTDDDLEHREEVRLLLGTVREMLLEVGIVTDLGDGEGFYGDMFLYYNFGHVYLSVDGGDLLWLEGDRPCTSDHYDGCDCAHVAAIPFDLPDPNFWVNW